MSSRRLPTRVLICKHDPGPPLYVRQTVSRARKPCANLAAFPSFGPRPAGINNVHTVYVSLCGYAYRGRRFRRTRSRAIFSGLLSISLFPFPGSRRRYFFILPTPIDFKAVSMSKTAYRLRQKSSRYCCKSN